MKLISYTKIIADGSQVATHYVNLDLVTVLSTYEKDGYPCIQVISGDVSHTLSEGRKILDVNVFMRALMNLSTSSPVSIESVINECNKLVEKNKRG